MASHKTRKGLALFILIIGLPIYIVLASSLVTWLGRPPILVELLVYVVLGVVWALPFKWVFLGVGQDASDQDDVQ